MSAGGGLSPMAGFAGLVGASFTLNLAFSILMRLDWFAGDRIEKWVDHQKERVGGALAEHSSFNFETFSKDLDDLEAVAKDKISVSNQAAVAWAIAILVVDVVLFAMMGLLPDLKVGVVFTCIALFLGFCAIPYGLFANWRHGVDLKKKLALKAAQYDEAIKLVDQSQEDVIAKARQNIRDKIADGRKNQKWPHTI